MASYVLHYLRKNYYKPKSKETFQELPEDSLTVILQAESTKQQWTHSLNEPKKLVAAMDF